MATVAQITKDELRELLETIIEQKLLELLGDPDEGLPIRKAVHDRLLRQKQAVANGERGEPFEDVAKRLLSRLSPVKKVSFEGIGYGSRAPGR